MKIGILGGTFDPPHYGHLRAAEIALEECKLDKVLFLPANDFSHKKTVLETSKRIDLLNRALQDNPKFAICDLEAKSREHCYAYKSLASLKNNHSLVYIIGSDLLGNIALWKNPEEIYRLVDFFVVQRSSECCDDYKFKGNIIGASANELYISSSMIRALIKSHKSIKYLVPELVEQRILAKHFYE